MKREATAGLLSWNRTSTRPAKAFFGSRVRHGEFVAITLMEGTHDRRLASDWFHGGKRIAEVWLTPTQFADFVTSPGRGEGVPCTLKYTRDGRLQEHESPAFETDVERMELEFREALTTVREQMDECREVMCKITDGRGTMSVQDRKLIGEKMRRLLQELESNLPYLGDRFADSIERTVAEAKQSVDAHINRAITDAGVEQLRGDVAAVAPRLTHED